MNNNNFSLRYLLIFIISVLVSCTTVAQVPEVYHNIKSSETGDYFVGNDNKEVENNDKAQWRLSDFEEIEEGVKDGIMLNFKTEFDGIIIYGLFPDEPMKYPHAVFFKKHAKIENGKAFLDIANNLSGKYDMANWQMKAGGKLRYRVLDDKNSIITNKIIAFSVHDGVFKIKTSITAGPFITQLKTNSLVIIFWTNTVCNSSLKINGKTLKSAKTKKHVYKVENLEAGKKYTYEIAFEEKYFESELGTAPKPSLNNKFSFAFASDSRGGTQLGESNLNGHNSYIMRKMAALATSHNVDFFQFTGDMVDGYHFDAEQMRMEYTNWQRTFSPYFHSIPFNVGFGNHEAFLKVFGEEKKYIGVDKYPFETESAEALFAEFFENPSNGPNSEDGANYDPNPKKNDFPSYKKNVYSYTYGNTAMIVLNSNYWYTPSYKLIEKIGGNPHGYIMQKQMEWLEKQVNIYENDKNIKHVFVTIHTPAFPNGGHANNDMWYFGDNNVRPYVAGKAVENGIIDQRDKMLDILVNKSTKFRVLLTGDEHNYSRLHINSSSEIYPKDWKGKKIELKREFVQIVNGAAGAPYYAQENLPWTKDVKKFSSQYALVIFNIDGQKIEIEVINPDTLELIEKFRLN